MGYAEFRGRLAFLSNFYPAEVFGYPTVEHAFVAAKTTNKDIREHIKTVETPAEAKKLGRELDLRPDWEEIKIKVMRELVREKFKDPKLAVKLLRTPEEIVEKNTWHDNFWGDCLCQKCAKTPGENHLGKILMKVREEVTDKLIDMIRKA